MLALPVLVSVVVLVLVGVGVAFVVTRDGSGTDDLMAGDCVDVGDFDEFDSVKRRSCAQQHDAEIVARLRDVSTVGIPEFKPDGTLGEPAMSEAEQKCSEAVDAYIGGDPQAAGLVTRFVREANGDLTDNVVCLVTNLDGSKLSRSLNDAG
jgi:hypothetical protein